MSTALTTPNAPSNRLHYLDNLRAFIVLVVVVFHVAMAFMAYAPVWWPVLDPQSSLFFTGVVLLTDVPIMPIMFMIAGYFAIASLVSKGQGTFWKDKLLRIVLPWILGFLIIAPTSPYLWLVARQKAPSFGYFWSHLFFTKLFNTQGALWFLGILTVFYLCLSLAYSVFKPLGERTEKSIEPGWMFFLIYLIVPTAVFVAINQFWFDFAWVPVKYILWVQPTRVSLEAFYFALGVYAYRRRWFAADGYQPKIAPWLALSVISGGVFFCYKLHFGFLMPHLAVRIGHGLLHCFFCLSTVVALFGIFRKSLDFTTAFLTKLAASSYAIYWVHMPIVLLSNLAIRGYHWNIFVKYIAVCALSLVGSFLAGAYGLGWLPMFAGKRTRSRPTSQAPELETVTASSAR